MNNTDYTKFRDVDTERRVIGACIFDPNIFPVVQEEMNRNIFTDYDCQHAYDAIKEIADEGKVVDMADVAVRLQKFNVNVTTFMTDSFYSVEVVKQWIAGLSDKSIRRRLSELMYKGEVMVSDYTLTMEDVMVLINELYGVVNNQSTSDVQKFAEIYDSLIMDVVERKEGRGEHGMMTGLHIFDSRYGWHGGDLIIIAGETSMGKSTLATTIAYNMAVEKIPCAYYSMEMSAKQLLARIVARTTQIASSTTLYSRLNDDEYNRLYDNHLATKDMPIYFDEANKTNFQRICSSVRRLVKRYGVRVVFIDYLQILANGRGDNREQLIGDMARDLKRLAVETNTAIVALSQLKRSDGRSNEPSLSRLRGSGQIEEACDMGVLIHRPNLKADNATIYLAKGRNVGLAKEKVKFDSALSYFCDYEAGEPQAPYQEKTEKLPF